MVSKVLPYRLEGLGKTYLHSDCNLIVIFDEHILSFKLAYGEHMLSFKLTLS